MTLIVSAKLVINYDDVHLFWTGVADNSKNLPNYDSIDFEFCFCIWHIWVWPCYIAVIPSSELASPRFQILAQSRSSFTFTIDYILSGQALSPRSRVQVFKIWDTEVLSENESWGFEQFLCMPQSRALGALKDSLLRLSLWCLWLSQWLLAGPVSRVLKSF